MELYLEIYRSFKDIKREKRENVERREGSMREKLERNRGEKNRRSSGIMPRNLDGGPMWWMTGNDCWPVRKSKVKLRKQGNWILS